MELHVAAQKLFDFNLHRHVHRHLRDHFIPHEGNFHRPHVLGHKALALYSVFLLLLKIAVISLPALSLPQSSLSLAVTPQNIIALSNQSRTDAGLTALSENPKLAVAALNKANHMMEHGYFAHYSPDGVSPWYWISGTDYSYSYAGENLAIRYTTAEGVTDAWLASPSHKANILSKDFTEVGVAVVTDNFGNEGPATLVVQMFGKPQGSPVAQLDPEPVPSVPSQQDTPAALAPQTNVPVVASVPTPNISFPLNNSFVNTSEFAVLGTAGQTGSVELKLDANLLGSTNVRTDGSFNFIVPPKTFIEQGQHSLTASLITEQNRKSQPSTPVAFIFDNIPPGIYTEQFNFVPSEAGQGIYTITVNVAEDAVRTIAIVGKDSTVLSQSADKNWTGEITLYSPLAGEAVPVEVYAQDLAGNEHRVRVGIIQAGSVAGVFNFVQGEENRSAGLTLFGGLVKIANAEQTAQWFALGFIAFLCGSLILKIAIKRHIQHPKTIAAASGVAMLAALLFIL